VHRYTLGVVYAAKELDAHKDLMAPEDLEAAAWRYAQSGMRVGVQHRQGTTGAGEVVESYIYRGPRWIVRDIAGEEQQVEHGDWLLAVLWDEPTWAAIQRGEITGYSLQGWAARAVKSAARDRTHGGGGDMPLLGLDHVRGDDNEGRQQLSPAIREAINAAIREALKQTLPRLADELEARFRSDVAELRRSLDNQRVGKSVPAVPASPPVLHWGSDRARR
jgi:hypothetical protein